MIPKQRVLYLQECQHPRNFRIGLFDYINLVSGKSPKNILSIWS